MLETTSNVLTNAGKHVLSNIVVQVAIETQNI